MLRSLRLYTEYFLKSAFSSGRKYVLEDIRRFSINNDIFRQKFNYSSEQKKSALDKAAGWLMTAQNANIDGGMGSYHLINKWSPSYPETTGYIIPTLIKYGNTHDQPKALNSALMASGFLLKIQAESGGWQGGRIGENKPEIVFNTGQVIRGMIAAFELSGDHKFLDSAAKAGRWLTGIQHPAGYWQTHALMGKARVYDTFVDVPLLELYKLTGDENFRKAAVRNLDWVIREKMHENGWFEDCDNTIRRNDKPILHTIAYTLDGLIDSSLILNDDKYLKAALKGSDKLKEIFLAQGFLNGRYDCNWNGSEYMICTGSAQMSVVWLKLHAIYHDGTYSESAQQMINLLIYIQSRGFKESENTLGAIPGSFPLWGRYEPFAFPNWATKFFCDALLLEKELIR